MSASNASTQIKIYGLFSKGILRYVGKTKLSLLVRLQTHLSEARGKRKYYRLDWLRSLEEPPIILLLAECPFSEWRAAEREWISIARAYGCKLVNGTVGGDGCDGLSAESNEKRKQSIRRARRSNNTSGATGVTYDSRRAFFQASIRIDGKNNFLGYFLTFGEASDARARAEVGKDISAIRPPSNRPQRNNTTGCPGVTYRKDNDTWQARFWDGKTSRSAGCFKTLSEATVALNRVCK